MSTNLPDANEPPPEADNMADQPHMADQPSVDPTRVSPAPAPAPPADTLESIPPSAPAVGMPHPGYGYLPSGEFIPMFPNGKPMYDYQHRPLSPRSRAIAALFAWFLGVIGIHRFYVGKIGTGVLMIFTLGGLGIWALIDFILIVAGVFRDKEERILANW